MEVDLFSGGPFSAVLCDGGIFRNVLDGNWGVETGRSVRRRDSIGKYVVWTWHKLFWLFYLLARDQYCRLA